MRQLILPLVVLALASGCAAPTQRIEDQALSSVRNQNVAITMRSKAPFAAMSTENAIFGMLGAAAGLQEGKRIVTESKVDDPAIAIAAGLARSLRSSQGAQLVAKPLAVESDDVAQIVAAARGKARFVVDVQTTLWSSHYFPLDWTHYRIMYAATARLIDADAQKVVAQGTCKQIPDNSANAPTYDELFSRSAARMKSILAAHADACVASLKRDMLGLGAAPAPVVAVR